MKMILHPNDTVINVTCPIKFQDKGNEKLGEPQTIAAGISINIRELRESIFFLLLS